MWPRCKEFSDENGPYVRRWQIRIGWLTVNLHKLIRDDPRKLFHSHEAPGISWLMRGGYREIRPSGHVQVYRSVSWLSSLAFFGTIFTLWRWWGMVPLHVSFGLWMASKILCRGYNFIPTYKHHRLEVVDGPVWTLYITLGPDTPWGLVGTAISSSQAKSQGLANQY